MWRKLQSSPPVSPGRHSVKILSEIRVAIEERSRGPYTFEQTVALVVAALPSHAKLLRDFRTQSNVDIGLLPILHDLLGLWNKMAATTDPKQYLLSQLPPDWHVPLCRELLS